MISISLNNESKQLAADSSLSQALELWDLANSKIAVAINGEFVPRSTYGERKLQAGDLVDIVKPVGGG